MKPIEFCYWLQGFFELVNAGDTYSPLNKHQTEMIRKHLASVFDNSIMPNIAQPEEVSWEEAQKKVEELMKKHKLTTTHKQGEPWEWHPWDTPAYNKRPISIC